RAGPRKKAGLRQNFKPTDLSRCCATWHASRWMTCVYQKPAEYFARIPAKFRHLRSCATAARMCSTSAPLEHDAEKRGPVFGKRHAPTTSYAGMTMRT